MALSSDDTPELRLLKQEVVSVERRLSGLLSLSFIVFLMLSVLSLMVILTPVILHVYYMRWSGLRCAYQNNRTIDCLFMR